MSKNNKQNLNIKKLAIITITAIAMVAISYSIKIPGDSKNESSGATNGLPVTKDNDIVIPMKDITETAAYYPAQINGTNLEVIAVKAPDGSIRTAFNTCQVCYSSGKGYYVQEGDVLVCQNCGNRFGLEDIEITRGGCNPVPITSEYKTVNEGTITISKDFLAESVVIFENWK